MTTTEYTIRSNARRAARAAGVDPDLVWRNASGKWQLPVCAGAQTAEQPRGGEQPERPAQEGSNLEAHPLEIPAALRVENRRPLTPEQREKLARTMAGVGISLGEEKPDPSKPKGLSAAEWRAHKEEAAKAKHTRALERVEALSKKESPKEPRAPGYKGHSSNSRIGELHKKYDDAGTRAAVELGKELGLNEATIKIQLRKFGANPTEVKILLKSDPASTKQKKQRP